MQYADIRAALENLKARDEEHAWGRLCTETALTRQEDWEWGWKQYSSRSRWDAAL